MADVTHNDIMTEVLSVIGDTATVSAVDRLKGVLIEREISRRADALVEGFDKLTQLKSNLNKIKPDNVLFDGEGKKAQEFYTQEKSNELKKAREAVKNMEDALNSAISGDFQKLYKQIN